MTLESRCCRRAQLLIHFNSSSQRLLYSIDDDVGDNFGQEVPPLVDLLKDILERYPEGGQILKVHTGANYNRLY